jgi:hypothetical protein
LSNSLDAGATAVSIDCKPAGGRDGNGLMAFDVACTDDGRGCDDPEILRRVGSTTSDLHAGTRGRFGQGLIDLIAVSESAEIRTLGHRLVFDKDGCRITAARNTVSGLALTLTLRHGGEGFGELDDYFDRVILPDGVDLMFNGTEVARRAPERVVERVTLPTVLYDPVEDRVRKVRRATTIEIHPQRGASPVIHELGIPVDSAPWGLPFDINVLQKTPLDADRDMLPDGYKAKLVGQLVGPMSDAYEGLLTQDEKDVPAELQQDPDNAVALSDGAQRAMVRRLTGAEDPLIRNPFDADDGSESGELESLGYTPFGTRSASPGLKALLKRRGARTVAAAHDERCKAHIGNDPDFPPETARQSACVAAYRIIAEALLGRRVGFKRFRGGPGATWDDGVIGLNVSARHLWGDPLGEESIGMILHECAHAAVSGHSLAFMDEVARLGGRLAGWVSRNQGQWEKLRTGLYSDEK